MKKYRGKTQQPINKNRKFVTVSLPIDITEILERIARVDNITRSYLITNILDEYVKKYDMKILEQREYVKESLIDFKN
jgi:metal-responsive CopG/Arc/MetJ family transcriptional regulator